MEGGALVHAWDDNETSREKARADGINIADLREADWANFAALILAPGVPLTHPEPHWTVKAAHAAGVEVIGDTELFCRQRRAVGSHAKIVAITGTNGKSTTTALTAHLLEAAGRRVAMGGNIGKAILALEPFADDLFYVIEYSSYQIDLTPTLDANTACFLNIAPDHIDRHGTLEHYAEVKARIFSRLGADDTAVIGVDDTISAGVAENYQGPAHVKRISAREPVADGVYAQDAQLIEVVNGQTQPPVNIEGIGSLRGAHNWQNASAAYALTRALGLTREEIAAGLKTFPGLAHRMEEVGHLGSLLFINDSKATNADAAEKALASFKNIYWILGGQAKDGGIAGLERYYPRIRRAYLIGEAAPAFADHLGGDLSHEVCGTLDVAVAAAARDAIAAGDTANGSAGAVLLSPACASWDQFPNFGARGDMFRDLVAKIGGVTPAKAGGATP
jgi:UDP-N-acetylmuramoylalanine--D-glutamate ligase